MSKRPTRDPKFIELTQDRDLNAFAQSVKGSFPDTEGPRHLAKTKYPFWFLMVLILCGYPGGANTILDLSIHAEFHMDWINEMVAQKFSPPSYSTFWWILTRLPPILFKQLLRKWFAHIPEQLLD